MAPPTLNFYPRSPCGERQNRPRPSTGIDNFYPRSPCGERQATNGFAHAPPQISIHALLAESDTLPPFVREYLSDFYPRSPCGERRYNSGWRGCCRRDFYPRSPCGERRKSGRHYIGCKIFLSTLSLRRATRLHPERYWQAGHFYPRSPCGERHRNGNGVKYFSRFLSTLSLRRATLLI